MKYRLSEDGIWDNMLKHENGCWEWQGRKNQKGYGVLKIGKKHWKAHRLAYTFAKGPIPDGMMILHSCDNPPCCNPAHLRTGTAIENMQDAVARGRLKKHLWAARKLDADIAMEGTLKDAAARVGCGVTTIWRFRKQQAASGGQPNKRAVVL